MKGRELLIQVAFRFDDPSPSSDHVLEREILKVLASRSSIATVAVTPFKRMNGELVGMTKKRAIHLIEAVDRGAAEIALHGFSHEERGSLPRGEQSEFAGLTSADQLDLIARGMLRLKEIFGHSISGFVPPWNSFDAGTLDAMERLGFRYLSAGWQAPRTYRGQLTILPRTCTLTTLEAAVREARRVRFLSPVIIAAMHHYDFSEKSGDEAVIDLPAFDKLLRWVTQQRDVTISSLGQMAASLSARECRRALKRRRFSETLHWRLQGYVPQYSLLTAPWWRFLTPEGRFSHS